MNKEKICLINIGNTHTQFAIANKESEEEITNFSIKPTLEVSPDDIPDDIPVGIACVVPAVKKILEHKKNCLWISPDTRLPIDLTCIDKTTIGADRIANASALAVDFVEKYGKPAISIDCGTAITFECVDANKRFMGGVILPGRKMLADSIHERTALLPCVDYHITDFIIPANNTKEAIIAGINTGLIGAVKEIIHKITSQKQFSDALVVITGGDAEYFNSNIQNSLLKKNLTLLGIKYITTMSDNF